MLLHMSAEVWRAIGQLKNLLSNFLRMTSTWGAVGIRLLYMKDLQYDTV